MRRRTILGGAALVGAALAGVGSPAQAFAGPRRPGARGWQGIEERLTAVLDAEYTGNVPGVAAALRTPEWRWSGAVGSLTLGGAEPLTPRNGFRLASVTKLFTAATVLRLLEQRRLDLADPIVRYLDPSLVDRVAVIDGIPYGWQITVAMLLNHTSGVYDIGTDPAYQSAVLADPVHRWTPREQIEFAIAHGKPYFVPGQGFHYSDTGYILAGQIVEAATGEPLYKAMRRLVVDPLALPDTYTESLERPRTGSAARAHYYYDTIDLYGLDPSFDLYGGGGLVSTVGDLVRFMRGLVAGRLFHHPGTLRLMVTPSRFGNYGMGPYRITLDGTDAIAKPGFGGVFVAYLPARDLVIATTTNHEPAEVRRPAAELARVLREAGVA